MRIKRIAISPEILFHMFTSGTAWKVVDGIPLGSRFTGITQDAYTQTLQLFVEHESFENIDLELEVAPSLETLFKKLP